MRPQLYVYLATCAANLASVAAGCVLTWSSPTIPKITRHGQKVFITEDQGAWLSSLVAFGASFGPFVASAVVNKIGRKNTIIIDMFLFVISWFLLAYSGLIYYLYFARILAGMAVGVVFTVVPIYVSEIAPMDLRGILGSLMQFFLCIGFLISYIVGPITSYMTLIIISSFIPLLCIFALIWVPESPHFLLKINQKQKALESVQWLRGYPQGTIMQSEITDILVAADEAKHNKGSIKELFTNKGYSKALYYACALAFFQQMSGINVIIFYAETIFEATGSTLSSSVSTIIIGLVMTFTAGFTALAAKIFGVKRLLYFSAIGEAASTGVLGLFFFLKDNHRDVSSIGWVPVTSLVFFIISYSMGFGPFVWVIMAEIFPAHLKAVASAVTASFCWFLCFILTRFFTKFTDNFGQPAAYWMFSIFCIIALFFVVFQLPDTEGKSYQEIQEMITGKKNADFSDIKVLLIL